MQALEERLGIPLRLCGNLALDPPDLFNDRILPCVALPSVLPACISLDRCAREPRTPSGSAVSPPHGRYGDTSRSRGNPYGASPRWQPVSHRPARDSEARLPQDLFLVPFSFAPGSARGAPRTGASLPRYQNPPSQGLRRAGTILSTPHTHPLPTLLLPAPPASGRRRRARRRPRRAIRWISEFRPRSQNPSATK